MTRTLWINLRADRHDNPTVHWDCFKLGYLQKRIVNKYVQFKSRSAHRIVEINGTYRYIC